MCLTYHKTKACSEGGLAAGRQKETVPNAGCLRSGRRAVVRCCAQGQRFPAERGAQAVFCLRSLTDAAGASPSKYSRQFVRIPVESGQAVSARARAGASRRYSAGTLLSPAHARCFEMGSSEALCCL